MGTSSETLVFDANASKVLSELAKIQAEYRNLTKEMKKAADAGVKGSVDDSKAVDNHASRLVNLRRRADEAKTALAGMKVPKGGLEELAHMERNAEAFTRSSGRASQSVTQLSFAMDDFITVAQNQEGWKGIIAGARGASNNLSVVLAAINPLWAIIPSVATALAGLGLKFFESGDSAEKAAPKMDTYADTMKRLREETEGALEGQKGLQFALEDAESANRFTQERAKAATERDAARAEISNTGFFGGLVASVPGLGGFEEERRAKAANKARAAQGRITDLEFKEAARQKAVGEKRQRDAANEADKEAGKTATAKLTPLKGALGKLAAASVNEGDAPDVTIAKISQVAGAVLTPEEARVAKSEIEGIATAARSDSVGGNLEAALDPAAATKASLKATNQEIASVRRERNEAERQSPRGRLSRTQEREFDAKLAPLERTRDNLQQAIEDSAKEAKASNDLLKEIRDALVNRNPGKPAPRMLARNGGQ